ncbi:FTR1 family protein, partial [Escherichia coli]|nr:FTR1 family protein [Escherichia coli]
GKEKNEKKAKGGRVGGGEEDMERGETEGVERQRGWWVKFKAWMERYVMFILPFVTVLRECVEAIVFVAGVSFAAPAT